LADFNSFWHATSADVNEHGYVLICDSEGLAYATPTLES